MNAIDMIIMQKQAKRKQTSEIVSAIFGIPATATRPREKLCKVLSLK